LELIFLVTEWRSTRFHLAFFIAVHFIVLNVHFINIEGVDIMLPNLLLAFIQASLFFLGPLFVHICSLIKLVFQSFFFLLVAISISVQFDSLFYRKSLGCN